MALPIHNAHPVTENPVVLRVRAILPAAGAFDAAPLEFAVAGFHHCLLYVTYDEDAGGANGAVTLRPEVSPYAADVVAPQESWFRAALYAAAVIVAGADAVSPVQREDIRYQATAGPAETFVYGPLNLAGCTERLRVPCAESGAPGNPGVCEVVAVLYE